MTVKCSPFGPKPQFEAGTTGLPLSGGTLTFYAAGSSTPKNTYTDSTGVTANANPLTLNASGYPPNEIWFTAGSNYKAVLKDSSSNTIWTIDNLSGINDTSITTDEWLDSGVTPTYVSTTSFTLSGDQTSAFHVGRRVRATVTAGTSYGRIVTSVYGALTTVTMVMDGSQTLDAGLSAVQYGILRNNVLSIPRRIATSSGTDTYTASVGATRLVNNDEYQINIASANTLTTPTLNLDSLGAKTIKTQSGAALTAGQLNGQHTFRYDGTDMIVLNPIMPRTTGALLTTYNFTAQTQALTSISNATPAVFTCTSAKHLPETGSPVQFTTSGSLPTGLSTSTTYYVTNPSSTTYNVCTTYANALAGTSKVATTGAGSGTHTQNSVYVKNTSSSYIVVEAWAAGGGGGGVGSTNAAKSAGGGAAGSYGRRKIATSSLSSTETIGIGAGGTAGANTGGNGGTGGNTTFGSFLTAVGGLGGTGLDVLGIAPGGAGQVGSGGDINLYGNAGGSGSEYNSVVSGVAAGPGGTTTLGGSGVPVAGADGAGVDGKNNSGAGGTGAVAITTTTNVGGIGGSGRVLVYEYS